MGLSMIMGDLTTTMFIIWDYETNQNGDIVGYLPNNFGLPKTGTSQKWQFEWGKE